MAYIIISSHDATELSVELVIQNFSVVRLHEFVLTAVHHARKIRLRIIAFKVTKLNVKKERDYW